MTLAQKLILYALAVALLPLAAIGFTLIHLSEEALLKRISAHQETTSLAVATQVNQAVKDVGERLNAILSAVDVTALSPSEREGVLLLLSGQSPFITQLMLVRPNGEILAATRPLPAADAVVGTATARERLLRNVSLAQAEKAAPGAIFISPAYYARGYAHVAVTVPGSFVNNAPRAVAALEFVIGPSFLRIEGAEVGDFAQVYIVDDFGRTLVHPSLPAGENLANNPAVKHFLAQRQKATLQYRDARGSHYAAMAPVKSTHWGVIVEQPQAAAVAAVTQMRRQILLWIIITLTVVLASGVFFAARVRRRLFAMVAGARQFGARKLDERVQIVGRDEIAELARTMNGMAADLAKSLRELEEWNRTLEQKVDERTRELRQTQSQLLTQSKLAAIGQLGAGVAHEVNNPLAGILGYSQLLLGQVGEASPTYESLKKIEQAALRCRAITMNLLKFSQRGLAGRNKVLLNQIVQEVLGLMEGAFRTTVIAVARELDEKLPELSADGGQLAIVMINLLSNAKNAMPQGGTLTIRTELIDHEFCLTVRDTGIGIEPEYLPRIFDPFFTTKKVWTGVGLGLSVAYRIVSDHNGRIVVESTPGVGSTFRVFLPRAEAA